jgi:hypothetical protein
MIFTSLIGYFLPAGARVSFTKSDTSRFREAAHRARMGHINAFNRMTSAELLAAQRSSPNLWLVLSIIYLAVRSARRSSPKGQSVPSTKRNTPRKWSRRHAKAALRLTILSGLVAGNFSAFWIGLVMSFSCSARISRALLASAT